MPHRKLVKIGDTPKLPSIQEFFIQMADRQHEEIEKLKTEIAGHPSTGESISHPVDPRMPVPDPWLLHPVRVKRATAKKKAPKKTATKKSGAKTSAKNSSVKRKKQVKKSAPAKKRK